MSKTYVKLALDSFPSKALPKKARCNTAFNAKRRLITLTKMLLHSVCTCPNRQLTSWSDLLSPNQLERLHERSIGLSFKSNSQGWERMQAEYFVASFDLNLSSSQVKAARVIKTVHIWALKPCSNALITNVAIRAIESPFHLSKK